MTTTGMSTRTGVRPRTSTNIPHRQLDQQPDDRSLTDAVIEQALRWPHVREQESEVSVPGARALVLSAGAGPREAFMIGREFCHCHAGGDFSFHATLPPELAAAAERAGWAEPHFLVRTGELPPTVVMIYAPRDQGERDTVLDLIRNSYEFAGAAGREVGSHRSSNA